MEALAYQLMAELETRHWWYRGRRAVVRRLLRELEIEPGARLLDVGSGTGGNLPLLGERGEAIGLEPSPLALTLGKWRGDVVQGRAANLPFVDGSFDVIAALDVLEHLHDELVVLDEFHRVVKPGGVVLLYVPAYALLWGHEDIASHHLRRYRAAEIQRLLDAAGFDIVHLGYSNMLLFPAIAAIKIAKRLLVPVSSLRPDVAELPTPFWNELLACIVEVEAEVAATAELPFGASILAAGRRR